MIHSNRAVILLLSSNGEVILSVQHFRIISAMDYNRYNHLRIHIVLEVSLKATVYHLRIQYNISQAFTIHLTKLTPCCSQHGLSVAHTALIMKSMHINNHVNQATNIAITQISVHVHKLPRHLKDLQIFKSRYKILYSCF